MEAVDNGTSSYEKNVFGPAVSINFASLSVSLLTFAR